MRLPTSWTGRIHPTRHLARHWAGLKEVLSPREWRIWFGFALAFALAAGSLLVKSHGLPNGSDGNESFSNLTHARAIANYGVIQSIGLTDETAATHPGASPYIHSHQGNFPRLFATLIYALGARTIESQVWVTTLTVGLSGFWFAFAFLVRRTPLPFALLACLVMATDYLLVMQWQVNTYRAWHAWFFFAVLWFVDRPASAASRRTTIAGMLLFAGLFYWEYVFAFYLSLLACGYAGWIHRRSFRHCLRQWLIIGAGGAIAAAILLGQLALYMGWANVLQDVRFTLEARNSAANQALSQQLTEFYDRLHVLFWPNFNDAAPLRDLSRFADSLLHDHLKYYTPPLAAMMLMVGAGWLISLWRGSPHATASRPGPGAWWWQRGIALVATGLAASAVLYPHWRPGANGWNLMLLAAGLVFVLRIAWGPTPAASLPAFLTRAGLLMLALILLAPILRPLLRDHGSFAVLWDQATGLTDFVTQAGLIAGSLLAGWLGLRSAAAVLGPGPREQLRGLAPLLAASLLAYLPTYWVFSGYVFSGYLYRQAPLLVFTSDLLLAVAFYGIGRVAIDGFRHLRAAVGTQPAAALPRLQSWAGAGEGAMAGVLALGLIWGWLSLQYRYTQLLPIDSHQYLQDLTKPPFHGRSFAVSSYASPISIQTGSWAMMEPALFTGRLTLTPQGFLTPREDTYKWFADRKTNPDYAKPEFALAQRPGGFSLTAGFGGADSAPAESALTTYGLVRRASRQFTAYLHPRVVAADESAAQRFNIVALDWDFPAFLAALPRDRSPLFADDDGSLARLEPEARNFWRIRLEVESLAPGDSVRLQRVQVSGQPVPLAETAVRDASWMVAEAAGGMETRSRSAFLALTAAGADLELALARGPAAGRVRVRVNDEEAQIDLKADDPAETVLRFSAQSGRDDCLTVPRLLPGQYAAATREGDRVQIVYHYRHQEGVAESTTRLNFYQQDGSGDWTLAWVLDQIGSTRHVADLTKLLRDNPDLRHEHQRVAQLGDPRPFLPWLADHLTVHPDEFDRPGLQEVFAPPSSDGERRLHVAIPAGLSGHLRVGILPGTGRKLGPEYLTNTFTVVGPDAAPYGGIKLHVIPADAMPAGQRQPLVQSGNLQSGSLLYLEATAPGRARLGLDAGDRGFLASAELDVSDRSGLTLEVAHGGLFPPSDHPAMQALPPDHRHALRRLVRVVCNGETVIESYLPLPSVNPAATQIGRSRGFNSAETFAGAIAQTGRYWPTIVPANTAVVQARNASYGPIAMEVLFPGRRGLQPEPLVTSGVTGAGNLLYVVYMDETHVRFGYDHWGVGGALGEIIAVEPGQWNQLTITMGSLYPPDGDVWFASEYIGNAAVLKQTVAVHLNGRRVFEATLPAYESPPQLVLHGENKIGGSTAGPIFSGKIRGVRRLPTASMDAVESPR